MSSADLFTTASELAVLQAGRAPVWATQPDAGSLTPPSAADSGVYLQGATRALLHVAMREQAHRRTARLTITVVDLTCTYTVTIDGVSASYNATAGGAADLEDIIDGLAAAIVAAPAVAALVTATAIAASGTGPRNTVLLRGVAAADYSVSFTQSDAATCVVTADPVGAELRLWWSMGARPGSTAPVPWAWTPPMFPIDRRGLVQRLDVAGLNRLHVQLSARVLHSGDGTMVVASVPVIAIGPALSEVL